MYINFILKHNEVGIIILPQETDISYLPKTTEQVGRDMVSKPR